MLLRRGHIYHIAKEMKQTSTNLRDRSILHYEGLKVSSAYSTQVLAVYLQSVSLQTGCIFTKIAIFIS